MVGHECKIALTYNVISVPPSVDVIPFNNEIIGTDKEIEISFSDKMRHDSLRLISEGNHPMASDNPVTEWLATPVQGFADTLIVSPNPLWSEGMGRSLVIYCEDTVGISITITLTYNVDADIARGTAEPENMSRIQQEQQITIRFTESMNTDHDLRGSLGPRSDGGVWSSDVFENDTLVISPISRWPEVSKGSFLLDCRDANGQKIETISLTYTVDSTPPYCAFIPSTKSDPDTPYSTAEIFTLSANTPIEIEFSETMNSDSLVLTSTVTSSDGDTLSGQIGNNTIFSNSAIFTNNYLTFPPPEEDWSSGNDMDLTISYDDLAWNNITITLYYHVDADTPVVTSIVPPVNSTLSAVEEIKITFNESMKNNVDFDPDGDNNIQNPADFDYAWADNNTVLTLSPNGTWPDLQNGNNYEANITLKSGDTAGNEVTVELSYIVDPSLPVVVSVTPAPGPDSFIRGDQAIVIEFSEDIDPDSLDLSGSAGSMGTIDWDTFSSLDDQILTLEPPMLLSWIEGEGIIKIQCADMGGNPMNEAYEAVYTIDATPPGINGNPDPSPGSMIDGNKSITINFTEPMDTDSLEKGGMAHDLSFEEPLWSDNNQALTLTPSAGSTWPDGSQTLVINCSDRAGNALAEYSVNYNVDSTPPTAVISPPSDSAISSAQQIIITFSEPIESFTLNGFMAPAADDGESDGGVMSGNNDILVISPESVWKGGDDKEWSTEFSDRAGNTVTRSGLVSDVYADAPFYSITPGFGAVIGDTQPITIKFNKAMNTASFTLRGSMAEESDGGGWVDSTTLVIKPAANWTTGADRLLEVTCEYFTPYSITISIVYNVDDSIPSILDIAPPSGSVIDAAEAIVIRFSESMDRASLIFGGTMADECKDYLWSTDVLTDDTLTLAADSGFWATGSPKTLEIDCSDVSANAVSTLNLNYSIFDGYVYVDINSSPVREDGTKENPFISIQAGVDFAETLLTGELHDLYDGVDVLIASGDYTGTGPVVVLRDRVSMYGGYLPDWSDRNQISTIRDSGGGATNPHRAVEGDGSVTRATVIDGFTIIGFSIVDDAGDFSSAVYNADGSSPAIMNNTIFGTDGASGGGADRSCGIYNVSSSPLIENNSIYGGVADDAYGIYNVNVSSEISIISNEIDGGDGDSSNLDATYGIYNENSSTYVSIYNNTIDGGGSENDNSYGIYNDNSSPGIWNNTIDGGSGTGYNSGIYLINNSRPIIENNIIFISSTSELGYGIYENDTRSDP